MDNKAFNSPGGPNRSVRSANHRGFKYDHGADAASHMQRDGGWKPGYRTRRSVLRGSASIGLLGAGSSVAAREGSSSRAENAPEDVGDRVEPTERNALGTMRTDRSALVIKDCHPWEATANEETLGELDLATTVSTTETVGEEELSAYDLVVLPSTQSPSYYEALAADRDRLTAFVEGGGVLVAHVGIAGYPCTAWEYEPFLPRGIGSHLGYYEPVSIVESSHPMLAEFSDADLSDWGSSTHGFLTDFPEDATVLAGLGVDPESYPTAIEYEVGRGAVLATTQTIEWPWSPINTHGAGTRELLRAELGYATAHQSQEKRLDSVASEKISIAEQITTVSPTIEEVDRVTTSVDTLRTRVNAGKVDAAVATEAIDRMILGENVSAYFIESAGPHATDTHDTAGKIVDFCIEALVEGLLLGVSIGRLGSWSGWGRVGERVRTARRRIANGVESIAETFTGGLSRVFDTIRRNAEEVTSFLEALIVNTGTTAGGTLAKEAVDRFGDARTRLADELIGGYEQHPYRRNVDDSLLDLDRQLGGSGDRSPSYHGTFSGAEAASEKGIKAIDRVLTDAEEELDSLRNVLDFAAVIGLVASALIATGFGAIWGAAAGAASAVLSIVAALGTLFSGTVHLGRAVDHHNVALDGVVDGATEVKS